MSQPTTRAPNPQPCSRCHQEFDRSSPDAPYTEPPCCPRCWRLRTCEGCGKQFDPKEPGWHPGPDRYCTEECFRGWRQKCWVIETVPIVYSDTDRTKLPNREASEAFLRWFDGALKQWDNGTSVGNHAFVYGSTGRAKAYRWTGTQWE